MKVIFFRVENVLNFEGSDAKAPDGTMGIAESRVKLLKHYLNESGARIVLYGSWKKDWDFADEKCTPNGIYLNKKLERKGLHILDKTKDLEDTDAEIQDWVSRHPNVTDYCVLKDSENVKWVMV